MSKRGFSILLILVTSAMLSLTSCGGGEEIIDTGVADIAIGRWSHTATLLSNGSVLIVGGESEFRTSVNAATLFGTDEQWSSAGDTLETRGEGHTATLLDNGNVLVVGGSENAEIYNTDDNKWTTAGSMEKGRVWQTAVKLKDGKILVAGGQNPSSRKAYKTAEIYDPSKNEWSRTEDMEDSHTRDKMTLLDDGRVLIVGKMLSEIYDPETGIWTSAGPLMKQRDGSYAITKLPDGRILVTGGETVRGRSSEVDPKISPGGVMASHDMSLVATARADIYDPSTGNWSAAEPMSQARKIHPAILLPEGKVLVLGNQSVEEYDPLQDKWILKVQMLIARNYGHTATMLEDGSILIVGGNEGGDPFNPSGNKDMVGISIIEIYDPNAVAD